MNVTELHQLSCKLKTTDESVIYSDVTLVIGFIWLRTEPVDGCLFIWQCMSRFHGGGGFLSS
jgi:hypothetical protein